MGICPEAFKTTVVKSLLKKPNLDFGILNDYRPMPKILLLRNIL